MKILSAAQIRKWDEFTILHEPISSLDLMERASAKCTAWIGEEKFENSTFKIFCGKGNNGGDGLAIARQLAEKKVSLTVFILESESAGSADFQANLQRLQVSSVSIHFIRHRDFFPVIDKDDIIIDALFGSGINRPLDNLSADLVRYINESHTTVISIDLPSGLFCDKATDTDAVIKAAFTLTFQSLKLCFMFPENEQFFGSVQVLDIGLHPEFPPTVSTVYQLSDAVLVRQIYKRRSNFSHKGTYGHALIAAGAKGKMGAAVLCSEACLRTGAGLVTALVPEEQFNIIQIALPEAMATAQAEIEKVDWPKYSTVGIGPGIGTEKEGAMLVQTVLSNFDKPAVIDADALNILAANRELFSDLPPASILTPHPKEFERLFGKTANHLEKLHLARSHAQKFFIYIILKGHFSALACPDGAVYFNSTGNAGMATGGSGDVLTGILTGLLSQGYSSKETCLMGMFLHGLAADIAVQTRSEESLIARDIIEHLGKAYLSLNSR